ncbi:hypothetical protein [Streptomyces sp. SLBN-31]|uniref:hypothetical protein n=1 Tax=Streptomyces sp. SLBN-31 TaxID=2768444 RepID=UPI00114EA7E0|nr:hypothetical protein [Streptomyces sp. SLBN-31]TQJ87730.1 hypothetical protein FBY22_6575 [Streptomyces sp. SLBN-31]
MAWDEAKFNHDVQTGLARIERWRAVLGTPEVRQAYRALTDVMRQEGQWIRAGYNPANSGWERRAESVAARRQLMAAFTAVNALHVSAQWATAHRDAPDGDSLAQARQDVAAQSVQNTAFWVKSTSRPAEQLGDTLEAGSAAGVLDQLTFGFDRTTPSPSLWETWNELSPQYAADARGTVEATVFEGLPENCVLRDKEWPELKGLIEQGLVDHLHVNVIHRNSDTGLLEQVGHYDVRTQQEFDHLPQVTRTDSYVARQQREFVTQNVARAIERNRAGVQTTLDDFRRRWSGSGQDVEFVLSHPDGPGPDLTESPANLSRVQTSTSGQGPSSSRRGSQESLMAKLEALESEQQQRRGSDATSIFPARRESTASLGSMPAMSRAGSFAPAGPSSVPDYPSSAFPRSTPYNWPSTTATSSSNYSVSPAAYAQSVAAYQPGGSSYSVAVPTTLPMISESLPAANVSALTDALGSFDFSPGGGPAPSSQSSGYPFPSVGASNYPAPPVANAGGYSPPAPRRSDSTPSTRSAGSFEGGGELTRVRAHTGDSPERSPDAASSAPRAESSRGESSRGESSSGRDRKPKKPVPSALLYFAGGRPKKGR